MSHVLNAVGRISTVPLETEDFDGWLGLQDAVGFLRDNAGEDEFVMYASSSRNVPGTY